MQLSAVVVNYRCATDTQAAVASVLAQAPECPVVVVDNSADEAEARRLRSLLPSQVRLLVAPRNLGFAAACNLAWRHCLGDYVLLLNPDARLLPQALAMLIEALAQDHRLAAVAPATWWDEDRTWLLPTLLPETPRQWLANALAERWPSTVGSWLAWRWLHWQQSLHSCCTAQRLRFLSAAVLLLRRAVIDRPEGVFDERFFMYYEDTDLSRYVVAQGYGLALLPQAHAVHRWRNRPAKTELMQSSAARYVAKYHPRSARLLGLIARLGGNAPGSKKRSHRIFSAYTSWQQWLDGARIVCISPTEQGFPAIFRPAGQEGMGPSEALWQRLDAGRYQILVETEGRRSWLGFVKADPAAMP